MTSKQDLEEKRDQLKVFRQHDEDGTWDNDPKEVIQEVRRLVFAWLIADAEEGLAAT